MARLTPRNEQRARHLVALYPQPRSALIPILHIVQEQDGYLTADGMEHAGEVVGLEPAEVAGTASFYDMFHLEPVGTYLVAVCTNIACMLGGAYELLDHAEESLGVAPGGTTEDGMFTLEDAECLALCGNAPCLTVNWRFFGDVDTAGFDRIIDDLRCDRLASEVPPHGTLSRVERTAGLAAPGASVNAAGGPTSAPAGGTNQAPRPQSAIQTSFNGGGRTGPAPSATPDLTTRQTTSAVVALDGGRSRRDPIDGPGEGSGPGDGAAS
ncbi:MAG: NAD(P)H-dependent oxidoreductase subunit E [Actinomycetota bacterium]|nr:NAD(P)H-dependent oxidoreductase subunit E [Actinomycetota bacterium]